MKNTKWLVLCAAFSLAATACGSNDEDEGTGGSGGGATAGTGGGATEGTGGITTTGSTSECTISMDDGGACDTCVASNCMADCSTCTNNPDCVAYYDCIVENSCWTEAVPDIGCIQSKCADFAAGQKDLMALMGGPGSCVLNKCKTECVE